MITIVDYGAGNIKSVANMLRSLGVKSRISGEPDEIGSAERLILPGVGHFDFGMAALEKRGLVDALNARVIDDKVPVLGICLGAQLLTRGSEEGDKPGLSWIDAETVKFERGRLGPDLRVPHMGWADTWAIVDNEIFSDLPGDTRFYYVHSYHMVCRVREQAILMASYGYEFVAGVGKENILGVQFHPEKSHRFGMQLLRNFSEWEPLKTDDARGVA